MRTNTSVKRALIGSSVACLLCIAMLFGSTFAWFTAAISSKVNTIQAGNLDLKVWYMPIGGNPETDWEIVSSETKLFQEDALYEPGYKEAFWLKVENTGTLGLKYDLNYEILSEVGGTNVDSVTFLLSDYLNFKVSQPMKDEDMPFETYKSLEDLDDLKIITESTLSDYEIDFDGLGDEESEDKESGNKESGATNVLTTSTDTESQWSSQVYHLVVLEMPENVGNKVNYFVADSGKPEDSFQPELELGIRITAVQAAIEKDSFDSQYDADAEYKEYEEITIP